MNIRKAITIFDDDTAYTILKPLSGYYDNHYFVLTEDAYGYSVGVIMKREEILELTELSNDDFENIIIQLE